MPVSMLYLYVRVNLLFLVVSVYAYVVPNHVVSFLYASIYLSMLYLYVRIYLATMLYLYASM